jgi:hypothetical protein
MAEMVRSPEARQEFWRPPVDDLHARAAQFSSGVEFACERCHAEFVMGARFCHVCGTERNPRLQAGTSRWEKIREYVASIRVAETLGLPIASVVAFLLGVVCLISAIAQGLRDPQTVLDWQAVQLWRIQWLLAGIAALVAGVLLKKSSVSN